jgi:hypothetical protein
VRRSSHAVADAVAQLLCCFASQLVIHAITAWVDGFAIGANDVANGEPYAYLTSNYF